MMKATIVATLRVDSMYSTEYKNKSIAGTLRRKGRRTQFSVRMNTCRIDEQKEDKEDEWDDPGVPICPVVQYELRRSKVGSHWDGIIEPVIPW